MNEDTFEEVTAFKITRWSVFLSLSVLFVLLVGLTIALVAFTPLRFYIPGYGVQAKTSEYESLKIRADSIENSLIIKQQYINEIQKVLHGNMAPHDTTTLSTIDNVKNKNKVPPRKRRRR